MCKLPVAYCSVTVFSSIQTVTVITKIFKRMRVFLIVKIISYIKQFREITTLNTIDHHDKQRTFYLVTLYIPVFPF